MFFHTELLRLTHCCGQLSCFSKVTVEIWNRWNWMKSVHSGVCGSVAAPSFVKTQCAFTGVATRAASVGCRRLATSANQIKNLSPTRSAESQSYFMATALSFAVVVCWCISITARDWRRINKFNKKAGCIINHLYGGCSMLYYKSVEVAKMLLRMF